MPVVGDADQRGPEGGLAGQIAHGGAFVRGQLLELSVDVATVEFEVAPSHFGFGGNDLHRLAEFVEEAGDQVGVAVDRVLHRVAQPVRVEGAAHGDAELHGVEVFEFLGEAGVEQQPLLDRAQRQHVGDLVLLAEFVDLLLVEAGGRDVGRRQPAAAGLHVRADAGQRLEPQPAQPV
ncbi:hypothetical protein MOKP58_42500 [Mycobacterium avium subsp. hominissuis]